MKYRICLILLVSVLCWPAALLADAAAAPGDATINVSGSAVASEAPDRVSVTFGVESLEPTSQAALAANARLMKSAVDALRDLGVEEDWISTSRFSIHAQYDNHHNRQTGENKQVLRGYRVSNILRIETPELELVAPIIDTAVEAGVNRVDNIQFFLSPAAMSDLQDALIEAAVNDARERAEKALAALGQQITGVKQVNLADFAGPMPMQLNFQRMEVAASAPTQVFASDQQVRTSVSVTFLIGPVKQ
ncbi:MAG: SIMPL domain-containing protein [Xanthomonadales bacterium]|nr:SIMPL domain-containing protein [Xanthomonadales bacterium]